MTAQLPAAFADLEPFAATWCLATEPERWNQRLGSSMTELLAFYDAVMPRLEAAIEHCDKYPLVSLPDDVTCLLHLIYSAVIVAMGVEVFGQPKTVDAADAVLVRVACPVP